MQNINDQLEALYCLVNKQQHSLLNDKKSAINFLSQDLVNDKKFRLLSRTPLGNLLTSFSRQLLNLFYQSRNIKTKFYLKLSRITKSVQQSISILIKKASCLKIFTKLKKCLNLINIYYFIKFLLYLAVIYKQIVIQTKKQYATLAAKQNNLNFFFFYKT